MYGVVESPILIIYGRITKACDSDRVSGLYTYLLCRFDGPPHWLERGNLYMEVSTMVSTHIICCLRG